LEERRLLAETDDHKYPSGGDLAGEKPEESDGVRIRTVKVVDQEELGGGLRGFVDSIEEVESDVVGRAAVTAFPRVGPETSLAPAGYEVAGVTNDRAHDGIPRARP
jgi:hypothetical protein